MTPTLMGAPRRRSEQVLFVPAVAATPRPSRLRLDPALLGETVDTVRAFEFEDARRREELEEALRREDGGRARKVKACLGCGRDFVVRTAARETCGYVCQQKVREERAARSAP